MIKKDSCFKMVAFSLLTTFFMMMAAPIYAQSSSKKDLRFKQIYFAAIRQKQKENYDAEYQLIKKALEINPNASEALYELAELYQQLYPEEPEKAINILEKAVKLEPTNNDYKESLAQLLRDTRQEDKAIKIYEDIAKNEKDPSDELKQLVQLYETRSDYNSALKTLDRLILIDGDNELYLLEKVRLYTTIKKYKEALSTTKIIVDKNPNNNQLKVLLGEKYILSNDTLKALSIYRNILKNDSNQQDAQIALMKYYNGIKDLNNFYSLRERFILNPKVSNTTKINLFRSFILGNKMDAIYNTQEKIINLMHKLMIENKPDKELIDFFSSYLYTKKIFTDQSIPLLKEILQQNPENIVGRLQLLQINMTKKNYEVCKNLCIEGTLYSPSELMFYYYGSIAQTLLKDNKGALMTINKGLAKMDDKSSTLLVSDLYSAKGDVLHELNRIDEAYAAYDTCLIYNNGNIQCLNNYAYFLSVEKKDLAKAEKMSLKVIKEEPENAIYLDTYAWILFCRNKMPQAKEYIDKALKYLKVADETANIYEHAGDIYACNNLIEEAVKLWKQARALGSDSKLLQKEIKEQKYIKK